jgi:hypothetical protein
MLLIKKAKELEIPVLAQRVFNIKKDGKTK